MLSEPVPINSTHLTAGFYSGAQSLDDWLQRRAMPNQATGASRTFVLCDRFEIVGYYALASSAVTAHDTTGKFRRNMPDPIAVVVLGRLAVRKTHQKIGLGVALFQDAAYRVLQASDTIGIRGLLVHAISTEAVAFYKRLGLHQSPVDSMTMMVTLADLRLAVEGSSANQRF